MCTFPKYQSNIEQTDNLRTAKKSYHNIQLQQEHQTLQNEIGIYIEDKDSKIFNLNNQEIK